MKLSAVHWTVRVSCMESFRAVRELLGLGPVSHELHDERGTADDSVRAQQNHDHAEAGAQSCSRNSGCHPPRGRGALVSWRWPAEARPEESGAGEAVLRQDRFVVASITKLVVACTTLSLVERGELRLDSPVAQWLPEIPQGDRITVRMLLGHRSGLYEYFRDDGVRRTLMSESLASWSRTAAGRRWPTRQRERAGPTLCVPEHELHSDRGDPGALLRTDRWRASGGAGQPAPGSEDTVVRRRPAWRRTPCLATQTATHACGRSVVPHRRAASQPRHRGGVDGRWTCELGGGPSDITEALFEGRLLREATVEDMTRRFTSRGTCSRRHPGRASGDLPGAGAAILRSRGRYRTASARPRPLDMRACTTGGRPTTTDDPRTRITIAVLTNLATIPVPAERLERSLRESYVDTGNANVTVVSTGVVDGGSTPVIRRVHCRQRVQLCQALLRSRPRLGVRTSDPAATRSSEGPRQIRDDALLEASARQVIASPRSAVDESG